MCSWNWKDEARALGVKLDGSFNMGYEISDGICAKGYSEKTALIWISRSGEERRFSFRWLAEESSRFAAFLKSIGVSKKDRVFVYSDKIPEVYISIAGILKAGGICGVLFSSFGREAVRDRLNDCLASTLIVQQPLLDNLLEIKDQLPHLKNIIVAGADSGENPIRAGSSIFDFNTYKEFGTGMAFEYTNAGDPAIIHYTSGTTGKPKGALHLHAALVGHYATTKHVLGLKQDDMYWCTADIAWVTGMSYGLLGPFSNAITQVAVEGNLRSQVVLDTIEKYGISVLYTAPTLLRMLMREKNELIQGYNLSGLRHIASVGEALNPDIIKWSKEITGLPVHDTWFQTETGCIMVANTEGTEIKHGSMGKPATPVEVAVLDEKFNQAETGKAGYLALKPGWPSMFATYWGSHEYYTEKFKQGWYLTGDLVKKDDAGYLWFISRNDDVINTAGHLVSPFEVESALAEYDGVREAAVIGIPDEMLGEKIKAFVVLDDPANETGKTKIGLRSYIRKAVSPFAVPQEIEFTDKLPKTPSGKIMRRLLKSDG